MKSFEELYNELKNNQEVLNAGREVVAERKKRNKISIIVYLIIDSIIVAIMNKIMGFSTYTFVFYIICIFIADIIIFIIMLILFNKKQKAFMPIFKESIIQKMINNFFNNVEYFPNKKMPSYIYEQCEYEKYDNYFSDDYIEATINEKYPIEMAEVHTEREETYTDSDGNTHTSKYTVFHGVFAKITMDKSIKSDLRITYNYSGYKNRLEMDSSEFEKKFDVFTSNKIIGMQLLTADIMEEILEFKKDKKQFFDMYIYNNSIYLRFNCGSMFEPVIRKKQILDEKSLNMYYNILEFVYDLSNKLIKTIEETEI